MSSSLDIFHTIFKAVLTAAFLLLPGCMSTSSYVDPGYGKTSYDDIQSVVVKYPLSLSVRHLKNGEPIEQGMQQASSLVASTLWTTGIFDLQKNPSAPSLIVIIDNISEKSAAAKGFTTMAGLGAIGTKVTDFYQFEINYVNPAGARWQSNYQHALHTVVGNKKPAKHSKPITPALGFAVIVEQVMLNAVKDLQSQGILSATR